MTKKLIWIVFLIPLSLILISFLMSNRTPVELHLAPFTLLNADLIISAPLFVFLCLSFGMGLMLGSLITWINQGVHRRKARIHARTVETLKAELRSKEEQTHRLLPTV
jgi:uncharacterized integral membrane protein